MKRVVFLLTAATVLLLLTGCSLLGPPSVARDRLEYNSSLATSWKEQILSNIIRIRYVEPLFFTDVGDIVASYSLQTGVTIGGSRTFFAQGGSLDFEGNGSFTDRPTITYKPLIGTDFFFGIMSPMPLRNILLSIESGASAAFSLRWGVRSINGLRNERLTNKGYMPPDPKFLRAVELLALLQSENALHIVREQVSSQTQDHQNQGMPMAQYGGWRAGQFQGQMPGQISSPMLSQPPVHMPHLFLQFDAESGQEKAASEVDEFKRLLGLDPDQKRFPVGFGSTSGAPGAITLQSHSLAQILAAVAGRVDVPEKDINTHRATPGYPLHKQGDLFDRILVRSAQFKPLGAFAAVKCRGTWFWVDDHDLMAKKVFSFIMLAFTMLDNNHSDQQLQLTVPTQ